MEKKECKHIWDKYTGKRISGKPWVGIKGYYLRTCTDCGYKEKFERGPVFHGWYSFEG